MGLTRAFKFTRTIRSKFAVNHSIFPTM
jgi:hypothetical protein